MRDNAVGDRAWWRVRRGGWVGLWGGWLVWFERGAAVAWRRCGEGFVGGRGNKGR